MCHHPIEIASKRPENHYNSLQFLQKASLLLLLLCLVVVVWRFFCLFVLCR